MISIIIPFFNSEKYLKECLDSIIGQSFSDSKIILVNDGSTDSSYNIAKEYALKDSRIIVINQENLGQAAARNVGLQYADTPYVSFVDSDDTIDTNTLQDNLEILLANPKIDCLQYPVFNNYGTNKEQIRQIKTELIEKDFYKNWLINKKISWIVCDKIFRTDLAKKLTFQEGIVYEDNLYVARLLGLINNIYISEKGLYYYFARENSTTTSNVSLKKEQDSYYVTSEITNILLENNERRLALLFLGRLINIRKSIKFNFKTYLLSPNSLNKMFSFKEILTSNIGMKDKIKIIISRCNN